MDYYSKIAKGYNKLHGEEQRKKVELIKKKIRFPKEWLLLDVGCGTGLSSDFNCNVIGIDPSPGMLKRNKHQKVLGYAENLPFDDNSFDCVVCLSAVHNFKDMEKGLKEIERVGKGLFIISVLKKSRKFGAISRLIKKEFDAFNEIDSDKDIIFLCHKKV